jgi:hypothetical protein
MDYVSRFLIPKNPKKIKLLKKEILMAYVSRSGDFPKVKMERWVAYIIGSRDQITKKGNIDGLCKQLLMLKIPKNLKKIRK